MTEEVKTKTKIHTVYKLGSGDRVPSVTTVLGILNKPALLDWAWQMGTQGLDYKAVRDNAGDIGTLAHYMIMCDIKGEKPDTTEYSATDIGKAETCLIKYWEWAKSHKIEPIMVETPLISEQYQFGGTIDFFGKINGVNTLLDFKTGKAIYPEFFYQLAAYEQLLIETNQIDNRNPIPEIIRILRIGRNEDEGFEERTIGKLDNQWQVFLNCLNIYNLQKEIRRNK